MCVYIYIYIYIYTSHHALRAARYTPCDHKSRSRRHTVGFHNFNLRVFNLRVSNPNKLIVDVFSTRCRISMCQGLGPKKHDEISETDRTPDARGCALQTARYARGAELPWVRWRK